VTVIAPTVICSGRIATASVAASRVRRSNPPSQVQPATPTIRKPVIIAHTRWNHSMKSGLIVNAGMSWSEHSGHWA